MKYPLVERAGLKVWQDPCSTVPVINAADVEKLLESAPVVYGDRSQSEWLPYEKSEIGMLAIPGNFKNSFYQGRLLLIEPIVKESEERQLLREIVGRWNPENYDELILRDRALEAITEWSKP